ncbi:Respiratory chain complex assembly or maintenance protein [Coemansia sp. RSA 2322]|uniref:COX assembly mitochondrial protein n=1 Tax=Coemansia thaxteri TaxID=2663907 RepID=A0A9W8BID8_9FUNG|nr:Respiratory chain complex assembly or maintenance protein [Coemansia thaxteri]KAJ2470621.1 Respiratory chain complex assembly or maintenance protein [Coemansia sp. RSA 2322]KAJ2481338.1 Respiratory chain complex assembly or maintenance protein [Coemansia sp. RSA 2320]
MHPALADHLNPGCIDLAERLMSCHTEHKWAKFFGKCNALSEALNKCLGQEFEVRRKKQLVEARARQARVQAMWAEAKADDEEHRAFERERERQSSSSE